MLVACSVPGRDYPVPVGGIISFWWATSFRYGGRDHLVLVGAFNRNQQRNSGKKSVAHLARESDANAIELNARN
jgi:hypothetical protein